jgi:hypothetical protein
MGLLLAQKESLSSANSGRTNSPAPTPTQWKSWSTCSPRVPGPRRFNLGPANMIFYTDYARGYLGRLDPEHSPPGQSPQAAVSSATWWRRRMEMSTSIAAPSIKSESSECPGNLRDWSIGMLPPVNCLTGKCHRSPAS